MPLTVSFGQAQWLQTWVAMGGKARIDRHITHRLSIHFDFDSCGKDAFVSEL